MASSLPPSRPVTGARRRTEEAAAHTMPPVLAYINEKLRKSSAAAGSPRPATASSTVPSRPGTADPSSILNKKLRKNRTFLRDNEAADSVLPQPLPDGIPYVAQFTTFDDLIERNILLQPPEEQVHLTTSEVKLMYEAKCLDQSLKPTWEREVRFMELLSANCKGNFFCLQENGLGSASAEAIARVLARNDYYSIVDLSGNRFRDEGARCIAQLLALNDSIVHLSLKSNDVGHDGGTALATALEQNCTLTSLDLGGISGINRNHLGAQGAAAIGQMLTTNAVLTHLDVSSNGLGTEGIKLLSRGFEGGQNTSLIALNLASNNLATDGCAELGTALEGTRLEHLDLQRNSMGDRGCTHIAHGLRSGTSIGETLFELNLDSNGIREAGCKALGRFLRGSSKIRMLSLNDNPLAAGVKHLFDAFAENRSLADLHLSHCMLSAGDAMPMASALGKGAILRLLELSKNRIGDAGAKVLADALRGNRSLRTLDLAANAIGNPGGEALAVMIRENSTLGDLNLRQNLISTAGNALEEQLRKNTTLRKMDFSFNDFSYPAFTGITATLARNSQLHGQLEIPKLSKEIEELGSAHTELFHIQEDIDLEKRGVREKTDECSRLRETINNNSERRRRTIDELRAEVDAINEVVAELETKLREETEVATNKMQKMEAKASAVKHQADNEHEKRDRAVKEMDRVRKALKTIHDQEAEVLRPLVEQYRKAEGDRNSDMADAKWQAENLYNAEVRVLQLEKALGIEKAPSPPPNAAPPAPTSTGSPTPRATSAKAKRK